MIGQPRSLRRVVELFRDPATAEKRALLAQRWAGLDPALRLPGQGLGQKATGCGATIGIQPRCDFACTGCYLGHEANHVPALPTAAILRQLDELRRYLVPYEGDLRQIGTNLRSRFKRAPPGRGPG